MGECTWPAGWVRTPSETWLAIVKKSDRCAKAHSLLNHILSGKSGADCMCQNAKVSPELLKLSHHRSHRAMTREAPHVFFACQREDTPFRCHPEVPALQGTLTSRRASVLKADTTAPADLTWIHCSRLISTPLARREVMARSMIFSTICVLPLASSSLAAVIQMWRSVGMFSRALFKTLRAFS